ncbi:MAG: LPS O-antigen length regulator [Gammaproteobacteria bacterium]|nr:LPS O-antigen length regulator [Gammaproteobacteria bacterium]
MSNQPQQVQLVYAMPSPQPDDEIDLGQIWAALWAGKWWIILSCMLATVVAAAIVITMPNIYRAKVVVAPSEEAQGGGLGAMAGQLGGLASLAGIDLKGNKVDKAAYAQEVVKSRAFVVDFIKRHELLVPLMAAEGWRPESDTLVINEDIYDEVSQTWVRKVKPPQAPKPSDWEAFDAFQKTYTVMQDKRSGMVTISVEHYSPTLAATWASLLVADINSAMRQADVNEAKRSIDFLKEHLNKTNVAEVQKIFYQLVEQQTKTIMLAEVRPEYVFKTVDPAVAPEKIEKPKRTLIVALATIVGGMLSTLVVLVRSFRQKPAGM